MFGISKKVRISVITWDACFREYFHTVNFFCRQSYPTSLFDFVWVDFYENKNPELARQISLFHNARALNLLNEKSVPWHLGRCINEGVRQSTGDLLVIPDGDIVVEPDFLDYVSCQHAAKDDLVLYFRRYDEPQDKSSPKSRSDIDHLKNNCQLYAPLNYGGCLTLKRRTFEMINGYETHSAFSGPGMSGKETYTRLLNAGMSIKWSKDFKIFHPWHKNTLGSGISAETLKSMQLLNLAKRDYPWINPGHFMQSWIVYCREINLAFKADNISCEDFVNNIPQINFDLYGNH